jgi:thioredoxin reductase (NADPH)
MSDNQYEIAIIGGGPAGITAALYAGRSRVKTIVLERGAVGGQLWNTADIDDYPGLSMQTGPEVAQKFEEHARKFGAEFEFGTVTKVSKHGDEFLIETDEGEEYRAGAVIVTAGGEARKLGVPGEKEFSGTGVSYCAVCDGAFFQDKTIAVVGGGDSAVEEGAFLTRYASKVHLIHRRDEFRASPVEVEHLDSTGKVEKVLNTVVDEIVGDGKVTGVKLRNVESGEESLLEVDAVFPFVGFIPHSDIFEDGLIETDEGGHIITDTKMETKTPGLFAAGDVRSQYVRQITNAVGDATTAALAASAHIESLKHKHADEAKAAA